MQSLEGACEEGERTIKRIKISRSSLPLLHPQEQVEGPDDSSSPPPFNIFTKFLDLHQEESAKDCTETTTGLKRSSHILEKLVSRERLNTLILNLYPGNKGYSLAFRAASRSNQDSDDTANMIEIKQWPYEEDELLRYIDNEELPPYLIDLFETHYSFLFYNGCIVAEVRDYRQSYPHLKCDIHHVLLRPTFKSLLADINNMAEEKADWGNDERQYMESLMLLANKPSLCLNPDNSISAVQSRLNHNRQMWNTHRFHRTARKYSQVTVNRKRKLDQFTHKPGLELCDFLVRRGMKTKTGSALSLSKCPKRTLDDIKPIPLPLEQPHVAVPSQGVVINKLNALQHPKETSDCFPQLVEEYVLETDMPSKEKGKQRIYHIKLSILQRPATLEYLGELYLDTDHKRNENNGVACTFFLGSRGNANAYIQQFTDSFSENKTGRKSVRIRYGVSPFGKDKNVMAQTQAQLQAQSAAQVNFSHQNLSQLSHTVPLNPSCVSTPVVNGTVGSRINLVQPNQNIQNTSTVPILHSRLQGTTQFKSPSQMFSQELEINALATKLMNSADQFQAAAQAKQQQQQQQQLQQKLATRSNTEILSLLNSSPASSINSDASAAVVNAINNSTLLSQQVQNLGQKLLAARKMTTLSNARLLNHGNIITVNNNRVNLSELSSQLNQQQQQPQNQTITLTSMNSGGSFANYTTVPIKQQVVSQQILAGNSSDGSNKSLSALLVGTPSADRPDIVGTNTNSLLLEKLASSAASSSSGGGGGGAASSAQGSTHFIQSLKSGLQYMVQSPPKANTVISPLSSPPSQTTTNTINFAQLQSLSSLPNVQVQLSGFAQPISLLNVSSTGNIQGHPTSLLVSMPVTTSSSSANTITQSTGSIGGAVNSIGVGTPTVVLANAGASNLAQLVTSGQVKGLTQQNVRASGSAGVTLTQSGQQFQLLTPLQRPRLQQAAIQQNLANRTIQRTPITIKMASPNANATQVTTLPPSSPLTSQLQKQAQYQQQYQQLCLNQQQKNITAGKQLRRRSNTSDPQ